MEKIKETIKKFYRERFGEIFDSAVVERLGVNISTLLEMENPLEIFTDDILKKALVSSIVVFLIDLQKICEDPKKSKKLNSEFVNFMLETDLNDLLDYFYLEIRELASREGIRGKDYLLMVKIIDSEKEKIRNQN